MSNQQSSPYKHAPTEKGEKSWNEESGKVNADFMRNTEDMSGAGRQQASSLGVICQALTFL